MTGKRQDLTLATLQLQAALDKLLQAEPMGRSDWLLSARIYRTCRDAGLTIRSPMDCLIASHAIRLNVPVLAIDRDFEAIASCTPLRLHRPKAQWLDELAMPAGQIVVVRALLLQARGKT